MPLIAAKCPGCGAAIQLPSERQNANCMYCGISVLVEQAVNLAISTGPSSQALVELGESSLLARREEEAYSYFSRALESDASNSAAWLGKAKASIGQASLKDMRVDEVLVCAKKAVELRGGDKVTAGVVSRLLSEYALMLTNATHNHFVKHGGTLVGPYGSMQHIVDPTESSNWINGIISAVNVHIDAIEIATSFDEESLPSALSDGLESLQGFVSRAFMAEVSCFVQFTDGTSHRSNGMVPVNVGEQQRGQLLSMYDIWRDQLSKIDPQKVGDFPNAESILSVSLKKAESANSMCFVATACYGDGDHSSVVILRNFRDEILQTFPLGRAFVRLYYKRSPIIAQYIASRSAVRSAIRILFCVPSALAANVALSTKRLIVSCLGRAE